MNEVVSVYKPKAWINLGGSNVFVMEVRVEWGMNIIPKATIHAPIIFGKTAGVVTIRGDDASDNTASNTYKTACDIKDSGGTIDIHIRNTYIGGEDGGESSNFSFSVSGWFITDVRMDPQSRSAPGGVVIVAEHPMCKLMDAAGFFWAPGVDFDELLTERSSEIINILTAGDTILDIIYKQLVSSDYCQMKLGELNDYKKLLSKAADAKLSKYIKPEGKTAGLPTFGAALESGGDSYKKACGIELAMQFLQLSNSVPFKALIALCDFLGCYIAPDPKEDQAKLKVLDPWNRAGAYDAVDKTVYSTAMTGDSDPIVGVRFLTSKKDSMIISTLANLKPEDKKDRVGGEYVYLYTNPTGDDVHMGRMINMAMPQLIAGIFARTGRIIDAKKTSTLQQSGVSTEAPNAEWVDPTQNLSSVAQDVYSARAIYDNIQGSVAKAVFLKLHRETQRLSIIRVLTDSKLPEIGKFISVDAGTNGEKITGMVTSNAIDASSTSGCTITTTASYCGEVAKDPKGGILSNPMW